MHRAPGVKGFLKCERGTQMIEFAFLLPFLIILFASAVELGRMFYTYTTLQKATEVGARYLSTRQLINGSYAGVNCGNIPCTTAATNLIVCGTEATCTTPIARNFSSANVGITAPGTGVGARYVTVTVTYAYQPRFFNLASLTGVQALSLNFTFTPSIRMRYML